MHTVKLNDLSPKNMWFCKIKQKDYKSVRKGEPIYIDYVFFLSFKVVIINKQNKLLKEFKLPISYRPMLFTYLYYNLILIKIKFGTIK